jgi:hypothetical protein
MASSLVNCNGGDAVAARELLSPAYAPVYLSRWDRMFLALSAALSSTILLKIADIQYMELVFAAQIVLLAYFFMLRGLSVRLLKFCVTLACFYIVFLFCAIGLSLVALREQFYYPRDLSFLKFPVWITLARSAEFIVDAGGMIYLVHIFRFNRGAYIFTLKAYFWVGVFSSIYSILTYPLNVLGIVDLGTYDIDHRMRGFYNEGGPYGLYCISVILVGLALFYLEVRRPRFVRLGLAVVALGLLGSRSKAAVFALVFLFILDSFLVRGVRKKIGVTACLLVVLFIVPFFVDVPGQLRSYERGAVLYERLSKFSYNDGNFVYGRIAGAFIVPRMILAHPVLGVGWGNYGLVRNDPRYRGASAWANLDDQPSLGLAGTSAELGIPLILFLLLTLLLPFFYLHYRKAPLFIQNMALLQPLVHIFGAQLNVTYPWVVTAFALGLGQIMVSEPISRRSSFESFRREVSSDAS